MDENFGTHTLHNLVKENKNRPSSGMAYISTICQTNVGWSSSIIAESGGFANVETASHELAHSLGARHDGSNGNEACSVEHGHIMSPSVALRENFEHNFFTFSSCSVKSFNRMLSSEQASCLFDTKSVEYSSTRLPGQWLSPDKQCKHVFGSSSGECRAYGTQEGDEICQILWCKDTEDKYGCVTKSGLHAVYGTPCSKGKMCDKGKCVKEFLTSNNKHHKSHRTKTSLSKNKHNLKLKSKETIRNKNVRNKGDHSRRKSAFFNENNEVKDLLKESYNTAHLDEYNLEKEKVKMFESPTIFELEDKIMGNEHHNTKLNVSLSSNLVLKLKKMDVFTKDVIPSEPNPVGDRRYLAIPKVINKENEIKDHTAIANTSNEKAQGEQAKANIASTVVMATEIVPVTKRLPATTSTTIMSISCTGDKNSNYCRNVVYQNGRRACNVANIASYCCYSCSFYNNN